MKIGKFESTLCSARFDPESLRRCINFHYLDQENCNEYDEKTGKYVSVKHPNIKDVEKAQVNVYPSVSLVIQADLDENGRLSNFKVKDKKLKSLFESVLLIAKKADLTLKEMETVENFEEFLGSSLVKKQKNKTKEICSHEHYHIENLTSGSICDDCGEEL
jgi:hypothetical protein